MLVDATVVIATYNRADILRGALDALGRQQTPADLSWELIVVDNNSTDATGAVVEEFASAASIPVCHLFEPRQGKSHALNTAIGHARGQIVAFTDDDTRPAPDWIAETAAALRRWNADGVGGRIVPDWHAPIPHWLDDALHGNLALMEYGEPKTLTLPLRRPPKVWGANMAFRRELFADIGHFDTALGPTGRKVSMSEDTDFVVRALRRGYTVVYDPALVVHHRIGPERMRKPYFRKWRFDTEEARAAHAALPGRFKCLGVPWWGWRHVGRAVTVWAIAAMLRRADAFQRELDVVETLGFLSGCVKHWRARKENIDAVKGSDAIRHRRIGPTA